MNVLRILILCISAALVCASIRMVHPEIATVIALAAGIAALTISANDLHGLSRAIAGLEALSNQGTGIQVQLLKICGIAMVAEFASDICRDANEVSLAHRIDTGVRLGIVAAALPTAAEIIELISSLLP